MLAPDETGPDPAADELPPPLPQAGGGLPLAAERKVLLAEVAAVLCLAVVPHLVYSLIYYFGADAPESSFGLDMLVLAVGSVQVSAPLLYILWRSGEPLASFGLQRPRWLLDGLAGIVVFFLLWMVNLFAWQMGGALLGGSIVEAPTQEGLFSAPRSAATVLIFYVAMAANAFAEELAMRGYLITRLGQLGVSSRLTVLISAGLFGAYHIYQGVWASILITLFGIVFAGAFLLYRRLWPIVLGHFLIDLLAFFGTGG